MTEENAWTRECWSANDEDFNCVSLADLLNENEDLKPGDTVYRAQAIKPDPTGYVHARDVIELLVERAWDDGGEYAEGWPDIGKEEEEELNQLLESWIRKHCPTTTWWRVKDSTPYVLTESDF
ncbi:hypothetical protein [Pseudomonas aeruginosa]|uniref:hypothetical protein n=1 Tax=Pseudomonas aeruginosa TaxID=287 RepID=UPI0026EFBFC9|nr:hypothetical protein [Pseudomonas aeruginosa]